MRGQASIALTQADAKPASVTSTPTKDIYDTELSKEKFTSDFGYMLKVGWRKSNIKPMRIVRDFLAVCNSVGRLSLKDYFLCGLYDSNSFSLEEKRRFISDRLHWPITHKCCDMSWQAMTEDKWMSYQLIEKFGLRTPETLAVIDRSSRNYDKTATIATAEAFKNFLCATNRFPLFCKANNGLGSFGAFVIKGIDGDMVLLDQAPAVSFDTLFDSHIGTRSYIVQACLENHPAIGRMTKYLATVRLVNLVDKDRVVTPFAAIKIPSTDNIADNFWRSGNILADIDVNTGVLRRAISGKGVDTQELELYPDTSYPLVGLQLPYWEELRALNKECVSYFTPIKYNSLDIAITENGPVVVEMNTGGSFELPQLASGRGLLTDEVFEFFKSCGVKFKGKR